MKFDNYSIRLLEIQDLDNYYQLVKNNRERLEDFFTGTVSKTKTYEDTRNFVIDMVKRTNDKVYFPYLVIDNSNQKIVGFLDLKNIDWGIPKSEIGFYIDKDYAGKGITSKALNLLCDFCFSDYKFQKIFLRTHSSNISARTVSEKSGFELEGIIRKDYKTTSGEIVDLIYYGKLK
jgi:RimJ/RimL family protein N-acetyltransferase